MFFTRGIHVFLFLAGIYMKEHQNFFFLSAVFICSSSCLANKFTVIATCIRTSLFPSDCLDPVHTGRGAPGKQVYANFLTHYHQWEYSHRFQRVCAQICVQICLRVLCEQGLTIVPFSGECNFLFFLRK